MKRARLHAVVAAIATRDAQMSEGKITREVWLRLSWRRGRLESAEWRDDTRERIALDDECALGADSSTVVPAEE